MGSGSNHVSLCMFMLANGHKFPNAYIVAGGNVQSSWFSAFDGDRHHPYLKGFNIDHFLNIFYIVSESGMIDQILYEKILVHFFKLWRVYARDKGVPDDIPLVHICDFCDSHKLIPDLVVALLEFNIALCTMPHNSSTIIQWLDLKWFIQFARCIATGSGRIFGFQNRKSPTDSKGSS